MQQGRTPLHVAVEKRLFDAVTLLLDRAADVNAKYRVSIDAR